MQQNGLPPVDQQTAAILVNRHKECSIWTGANQADLQCSEKISKLKHLMVLSCAMLVMTLLGAELRFVAQGKHWHSFKMKDVKLQ